MRSSYYRYIILGALLSVSGLHAREELAANSANIPVTNTISEQAANELDQNACTQYFGRSLYLDLPGIFSAVSEDALLQAPPAENSREHMQDEKQRRNTYEGATTREIIQAVHEQDGVFSFACILGPHFNPEELPKTQSLFEEIYADSRLATAMAKHHFKRRRPLRNEGYSYPSAHSTRAFLWSALLSTIFTDREIQHALEQKAWEKAWDRVILGRHYPLDIHAGRVYGQYLCYEFLKDPQFCKKWNEVVEEIRRHVRPDYRRRY